VKFRVAPVETAPLGTGCGVRVPSGLPRNGPFGRAPATLCAIGSEALAPRKSFGCAVAVIGGLPLFSWYLSVGIRLADC
jgi:hypothetical protein